MDCYLFRSIHDHVSHADEAEKHADEAGKAEACDDNFSFLQIDIRLNQMLVRNRSQGDYLKMKSMGNLAHTDCFKQEGRKTEINEANVWYYNWSTTQAGYNPYIPQQPSIINLYLPGYYTLDLVSYFAAYNTINPASIGSNSSLPLIQSIANGPTVNIVTGPHMSATYNATSNNFTLVNTFSNTALLAENDSCVILNFTQPTSINIQAIEFWFYPKAFDSLFYLMNINDNSENNYWFGFGTAITTVYNSYYQNIPASFYVNSIPQTFGPNTNNPATYFTLNSWNHCVINMTSPIVNPDSLYLFGTIISGYSFGQQSLYCTFGESRVYSTALTPTQVLCNYNGTMSTYI